MLPAKDMMPGSGSRTFPHRRHPDGTCDSICPTCFRTIASRMLESELVDFEVRHRCDPETLRILELGRNETSR